MQMVCTAHVAHCFDTLVTHFSGGAAPQPRYPDTLWCATDTLEGCSVPGRHAHVCMPGKTQQCHLGHTLDALDVVDRGSDVTRQHAA